jgi:hypothetical protein
LAAHGQVEDASAIEGACSRHINIRPPEGLSDRLAPNHCAQLRAGGAAIDEKDIVEFIRSVTCGVSA